METLTFEHRTFSKTVKQEIAKQLDKVKSYKRAGSEFRLLNADNKTVAIWQQTLKGSRVILNSWY